MSKPDGGPASPVHKGQACDGSEYIDAYHPGKSLRDYFAAAALQGLLASAEVRDITFEDYAKCAYHHANAMLKEREK